MLRVDLGVRTTFAELGDVPTEKLELYQRLVQKPIHTDVRVPGTRWVVLRYPNPAMAQLAARSVEGLRTSTTTCARWTTRA